jgi:integrase
MKERRTGLTKRVVDAAKPEVKDYPLWDSKLRGFGVRVFPSGVKSFIVQYRNAAGRTRKLTLGRYGPLTVDKARDKATKALAAVIDGADPSEDKAAGRRALTITQLADLYLWEGPADKPNKKTSSWETDRSNIERHIKPLLGTRLARALTKTDVSRFQAEIAAGKTAKDEKTGPRGRAIVEGGKGIASRTLAVLSAMMTFAERRGIVVGNPVKGVRPFRGQKKERFLTDAEVAIVGHALTQMEEEGSLPPVASAAIKLLLLTGCRRGEILSLRWEEVDFERECLRLSDSKTGAKVIRLAASALSLLAALPRTSPWVLPSAKGSGHYVGLPKHWKAVKVRARSIALSRAKGEGHSAGEAPHFADVRIHDLRHSFASFAIQSGGSLYLVGKVLGHKQSRTTEIYAHAGEEPVRATAELAARRIATALGEHNRNRNGPLKSKRV